MVGQSPAIDRDDALAGTRRRAAYNVAEREFSVCLQQRLHQVLDGRCNFLELLRRYPDEPDRLGVMVTPAHIQRDQLRLPVVEGLLWDAINFVRADVAGGPVSQNVARDGSIVETQVFTTRFPHIVIERTDRYVGESPNPAEITWCLRRVQNQRTQTQVNRFLDAANLAFELLRVIR